MTSRGLDFVCPACGRPCGDPLYRGPHPHAPARLCMDCWAEHWHEMEMRMLFGGAWDVVDEALWLVSFGLSAPAAAALIARHRKALRRWLLRMRKYAHLIPDWLGTGRPGTRSRTPTTDSDRVPVGASPTPRPTGTTPPTPAPWPTTAPEARPC